MSEIAFPLVASVLVFLLVLPLSALVARGALALLDVFEDGLALHRRWHLRYLVIVGSSVLPLAWFISASLHQAESGAAASVCTVLDVHDCPEPGFLAALLCLIAGVRAFKGWSTRPRADGLDARTQAVAARVASLLVGDLADLRGRVVTCIRTRTPIETVGVFHRRVVLRTAFAASLDHDALAGALHHELEHLRGWDPLRYEILRWSMDVNPAGRLLLGRHVAGWVLGREAHCDRAAVMAGAEPTALAAAIVEASRRFSRGCAVALGAADIDSLRLRIQLLLAYADRSPHACCERPTFAWLALAVAFALGAPHGQEHPVLDAFHVVAEQGSIALLGE